MRYSSHQANADGFRSAELRVNGSRGFGYAEELAFHVGRRTRMINTSRERTVFVAVLVIAVASGMVAQSIGISPAEQKEGFQPLFDGQTLKGWTPRPPPAGRDATAPPAMAKWAASNGEIAWVPDTGRGYLVSEPTFTNFDLRVDFFSDAKANTGVNIGIPDTGDISSATSFEVNIFDNTQGYPTGSINNVVRTSTPKPSTVDKWNSLEIVRQGDHITVKLNGDTVVDTTSGLHPVGHIGLQAPAEGVTKFRNLRIKPL